MILKQKFFNRPALKVTEDLLGKFLVRKIGNKEVALMITEVEAYDGFQDKASHAHRGKTKRNEVMFSEAGRFYIYLIYGFHNMLNIVTGKKNYPAAILIRGAGDISGPGRLTKFLKIGRHFNNKKANRKSGLWIEDRGIKISKRNIKRTPRIGVNYAGKIWAKKPYRFFLKQKKLNFQFPICKLLSSFVFSVIIY